MLLHEAVINPLVDADYAKHRFPIWIALFDDWLEIANLGLLLSGLSLKSAFSGFSQLKNKVLGREFPQLKLTKSIPWAPLQEPIFQYFEKYDKINAKAGQEIRKVTEGNVLGKIVCRNIESFKISMLRSFIYK